MTHPPSGPDLPPPPSGPPIRITAYLTGVAACLLILAAFVLT